MKGWLWILGAGWVAAVAAAEPVPQEAMLSTHNRVRAAHDLPPLKWSSRLERDAAAWADHLAKDAACKMVHSDTPDGENLFWASPRVWSDGRSAVQDLTSAHVVQSWASEQADYDYETNTCRGEQCGHYTQIVWEETKALGCARSLCKNLAQIWVCRYSPPGNFVGERPY